jgi:hypothetical protein
MSKERHPQDDLSDPLVSGTYRELSDEHTPEHLDHVVLNAARKAAKPEYARTISWLRPAAWVTTVGLCLAIVLEVSDVATTVQSVPGTPTEVEQEAEEAEVVMPTADKVGVPAPATRSSDAARDNDIRDGKHEHLLPETRQDQPAALSGQFEQKSAEDASAPELFNARRQEPAAIKVESFDQDDRRLLREAEDRARMQTGSDQESVVPLQQVAPTLGVASDATLERFCEAPATEDPDEWLACILDLEQKGLLEAAKVERDLLRESFPDAPLLISR